jgi:ATP-dependent Clp protease ATP-binding subunit ClpC
VVLFDEVEKAHPDIFNSLLQILEDGKLTDAQGREVNFKNTIIIMTTNLGADTISRRQATGFSVASAGGQSYDEMTKLVNTKLKDHFKPEFLNRVDNVVVFPQLSQDEIVSIVDLMIARLDERMQDRDMGIELTDAAKRLLAEKGYDPVLGARPLRRAMQRELEDVLSEKILFGDITAGQIIRVDVKGEGSLAEFTFEGLDKDDVTDAPIVELTAPVGAGEKSRDADAGSDDASESSGE